MGSEKNLGFITVVEQDGYVGGYLITNRWGRPLEFRLTTEVRPSTIQRILYGPTLLPYVYADVIGRSLVEKASQDVAGLFTDCPAMLDLRHHVPQPIACLQAKEPAEPSAPVDGPLGCLRNLEVQCHSRYPGDEPAIRRLLAQVQLPDLSEPFVRIREALAEAKRLSPNRRSALAA